jgi:hypothetical protein
MSTDDATAPLLDTPAVPAPAEIPATTVVNDQTAAPAAPAGNHFERRSQNARGGGGGGRFQHGYSSTKPDNDNWNRGKRERSSNADGGEQVEDDNDDENDRVPKKKVCLMIGYSGLNYSGLQINSSTFLLYSTQCQYNFPFSSMFRCLQMRILSKKYWNKLFSTPKA